MVSVETIQAEADVISLHLFANSANEHFFNRDFFKKLKKPVLFINVARGSLIDEAALVEALDEGEVKLADAIYNLLQHRILKLTQKTPGSKF